MLIFLEMSLSRQFFDFKVNTAEVEIWVTVTQDFMKILDYALALCERAQGIYDVSIGKIDQSVEVLAQ